MRNTLGDLNNHLFVQLERLNEENLAGDALKAEIARSKAITEVAREIISNGALVLEAQKLMDNRMDADMVLPKMLEGGTR